MTGCDTDSDGAAAVSFSLPDPILDPARRRRRAAPACLPGRRFCAVRTASRDAAPTHPRDNGARPRRSASPRQARPLARISCKALASFLFATVGVALAGTSVKAETAPHLLPTRDCYHVFEEVTFCGRDIGFSSNQGTGYSFVRPESEEVVTISFFRLPGCESQLTERQTNGALDALRSISDNVEGVWRLIKEKRVLSPSGGMMNLQYEGVPPGRTQIQLQARVIFTCLGSLSLLHVYPLEREREEDLHSFETIWRATTIPADLREAIER